MGLFFFKEFYFTIYTTCVVLSKHDTKKKYNSCKYSIYGKKLSNVTHWEINKVFNLKADL